VMTAAAKQLHPGQAVYVIVGNGAEKVIVRAPDDKPGAKSSGKDVPYTKGGAQLTLREALADLAARGDVGSGGLVELDADGRMKSDQGDSADGRRGGVIFAALPRKRGREGPLLINLDADGKAK